MKLTTFLLLVNFACIAATGYSQTEKVSIQIKNGSLKDLFSAAEEQTSYKFLYRDDAVENIRVNLDGMDEPLDKILDQTLEGSGFGYKILANNLIVIAPNDLIQQTKVTGTVTDENGNPLPGVNVKIEGTTIGTITDINGKYVIEKPDENAVLVFSFIGYNSQNITVGKQSTVDIKLLPDITRLDEVVVIGYGTMKKSDLSGSVVSVKSADITAYPSSQTLQALQGRASGVQIQATNGDPGSDYKVRIRGASSVNSSSDPLFVVDGFPGASMPASEDIESVEVLKDASATAIYGSRGANGVIMVTTKRGKVGKTRIEFNSSYSVQNVIKKLDLLQTPDFVN